MSAVSPHAQRRAAPNAGQPGRAVRYQPLVIVLGATAAGIVADRYWPRPVGLWWAVGGGAGLGWLLLWRRGRLGPAAAALLLAVAATAAAWHHCRWCLFAADDVGCFVRTTPQPVAIRAIALQTPRSPPARRPDPLRLVLPNQSCRLEIELVAIRDGTLWRSASGRARMVVYASPADDVELQSPDGQPKDQLQEDEAASLQQRRVWLRDLQPGDRFQAFARLARLEPPLNPGEFDFAAHCRADRVRGQLRVGLPEAVTLLARGPAWQPRRLLEQLRMRGMGVFQAHLAGQSALADAVLLGMREQLDPDQTESFRETGTMHLLVIAGLHLGILAGAATLLLSRLPIPRRWALAAVALFTLAYMLLVDAQPPVVRATILVLSACGSLWFGRERLGMNVLAGAGLIVLALNPADLFRIGPQLSFLCVAGIMWLAPMWASLHAGGDPIQRLLGSQRLWPTKVLWLCGRSLRHLTLVSGTIWLLTLPLVMARFHLCSPVAVLLNTLVWIPMAMALVFGFGLLVLGGLPPAAWLCATLCQWNLDLLTWLVERGQKVPLGHHWVPGPADWWLAGFYGALGLWLAFPRLRPPLRWQVALLAGWSALGLAGCWPAPDAHSLRCTLLAVGHGEAVVVELPTGRTLLYDAGRFSSPHGAAQSTAGFLWSRGITHLDAVVLSHGDVDHYNGLPGLLDQFSVGVVYVSPVMQAEMDASREGAGLRVLRDAIRAAGVPLRQIWAGDRLAAGPDCTIDVLHPPRRGIEGSNNANCICLAIEYFGRRVLLTGDLEPPGLGAVLADPPTHYDVLLVPHHGSRQSDPERLAAWSTPDWSVISADRRWDLSRVKEIYRRGGGRVLHTAQTGAVSAVLDCQGARVETFLPPRKTPPMWE